jgi:anaerobic magnesium-protoporphyrin IX monomethyl ester cyclase
MRIALIGAEIEENLALRHMHASLAQAGHEPRLFGFDSRAGVEETARRVAAWGPDLAGLSMLFTARATEFTALAERLRALGWDGHLTAGGHFAALHARELLRDHPAFDSIAHGEGEELMVDLAASLDRPDRVAGLSLRSPTGVRRTPPRPVRSDLDARPWPTRPARFQRYLGKPIANVLAGRGCYGRCHFCSIHAWHAQCGGKRFRQREPAEVARELGQLYHRRGVRIFNFQDDNFLLPRPRANLERLERLGAALAAEGVGRVALQIKARPDSIDEAVVDKLCSLGLFRVFLGVETDAVNGLERLGRGTDRLHNHRALDILGRQGVHTAFNLLMFDPDCDIASLRENLAFMARQRRFPLNFCRVEVYAGTTIQRRLGEQGRLRGDYTGQTYTIADPAAQAAYELFWRVFAARNFGEGGLHHASMHLDYHLHLLRHFHPERVSRGLVRDVKALVAALNQDSARRMGRILALAEGLPGVEEIEALATTLRRERAAADRRLKARCATLLETIRVAHQPARRPGRRAPVAAAAAAVLTAAWVGADSAYAQDDDDSVIPEVQEAAEEEREEEAIIPVELPPDLPDHTHMCEAAPPPWDLYQPPVPPPDPTGPIMGRRDMKKIHERHRGDCSLQVVVTVAEDGSVSRLRLNMNPMIPDLATRIRIIIEGMSFGPEFHGETVQAWLWQREVMVLEEPEDLLLEPEPKGD